jgi:cytochrome c556
MFTRPVLLTAALAAALTPLLAGCSAEPEDTHPQRWVSQRQAVFKDYTRTLEPLGLMVRERKPYDAAAFTAGAQALQGLAGKPWPLFPADSNYPPTRAQPAVWSDPAAFQAAQARFQDSVARLLVAAQTPGVTAPELETPVSEVQRACKACHDRFRADRVGR